MNTIAQQLNIKEFPFEIKDKNENLIYFEDSTGFWYKQEFNSERKKIYFENSKGYWCKREYDSNGDYIYYEDSDGYGYKLEYDSQGKEIYYENSNNIIIDNRPKSDIEFTLEDITEQTENSTE